MSIIPSENHHVYHHFFMCTFLIHRKPSANSRPYFLLLLTTQFFPFLFAICTSLEIFSKFLSYFAMAQLGPAWPSLALRICYGVS